MPLRDLGFDAGMHRLSPKSRMELIFLALPFPGDWSKIFSETRCDGRLSWTGFPGVQERLAFEGNEASSSLRQWRFTGLMCRCPTSEDVRSRKVENDRVLVLPKKWVVANGRVENRPPVYLCTCVIVCLFRGFPGLAISDSGGGVTRTRSSTRDR